MTTHRLLVASTDGARQLELDLTAGRARTIGSPLPLDKPLAITADPTNPDGGWVVALSPEGRLLALTASDAGVQAGAADTTTGGAVPCHIAVVGERVAVANYSGHTVGVVQPADGATEPSAVYDFGEESHPHQALEVDGRLVVSDLGRDGLHVIDPAVAPSATEADGPVAIPLEDGAGPRNAVRVGPDHLVVALEKANAAAVVELQRDADGAVVGGRQVDRRAFAGEQSKTHPSQILLEREPAEGEPARVLVLNRGSDQLCVLEVVDGQFHGEVTEHPLPAWPMDLARVGDVLLVACRDADALVGLDITTLGAGGAAATLFTVAVPSPNGLAVLGAR